MAFLRSSLSPRRAEQRIFRYFSATFLCHSANARKVSGGPPHLFFPSFPILPGVRLPSFRSSSRFFPSSALLPLTAPSLRRHPSTLPPLATQRRRTLTSPLERSVRAEKEKKGNPVEVNAYGRTMLFTH
jgi:hypothetical protein